VAEIKSFIYKPTKDIVHALLSVSRPSTRPSTSYSCISVETLHAHHFAPKFQKASSDVGSVWRSCPQWWGCNRWWACAASGHPAAPSPQVVQQVLNSRHCSHLLGRVSNDRLTAESACLNKPYKLWCNGSLWLVQPAVHAPPILPTYVKQTRHKAMDQNKNHCAAKCLHVRWSAVCRCRVRWTMGRRQWSITNLEAMWRLLLSSDQRCGLKPLSIVASKPSIAPNKELPQKSMSQSIVVQKICILNFQLQKHARMLITQMNGGMH